VQVLVGPNAVLAFSREGYTWGSVNVRDLLEAGSFPGLWRLGLKHWRFALGEMYRSLFLSAQMKDIQMYLPQIQVPSANLNSSKLKGYTHVPLSEVQVSAALV
jgi:L-2-hydroxyglutarate oxidase LhgO